MSQEPFPGLCSYLYDQINKLSVRTAFCTKCQMFYLIRWCVVSLVGEFLLFFCKLIKYILLHKNNCILCVIKHKWIYNTTKAMCSQHKLLTQQKLQKPFICKKFCFKFLFYSFLLYRTVVINKLKEQGTVLILYFRIPAYCTCFKRRSSIFRLTFVDKVYQTTQWEASAMS